jgi:uncharacterized protein (DUF1697 family)
MKQYIAFLRAINITGHFVKMEELRRLFEGMGFANVATYIQSGNVLFAADGAGADALERMIEGRLREALGFEVATFLRSKAELIEVAGFQPWPNTELADGDTLYVTFVREEPSPMVQQRLIASSNAIDLLQVYKRQVFWLWRRHLGPTTFNGAKLEKTLGGAATVRNMTTVRKLVAKYLR